MKNIHLACIGAGNMGRALLRGLVQSKRIPVAKLRASDREKRHLAMVADELKIKTTTSNVEAVQGADVVILAVKPQILDRVLEEIREHLKPSAMVLSIAAGYPTALIEKLLGGKPRIVRSMPNIAAAVGQAASAITMGRHARRSDAKIARQILETCGTVTEVDESLMDAVTGLSGTGPMYIFIIIEALSDAGVKVGLSREQSTTLAIQTVLGAARMVQQTGQHPIYLKDLVTSPGGTAINALYSMEKTGMRAVIMDAVEAATNRSRELGQVYND